MKTEIEAKDFPFFKLSTNRDLILFLIKLELQRTKFDKELERIGFDRSVFPIDLGVIILSLVGFEDHNELRDWYYQIMDSYADKIALYDSTSAHELALDFYLELRTRLKQQK